MRIVIAGAGNVGMHLVKMFTNDNHDVVVIDNQREKLEDLSSHFDIMPLYGSATSLKILQESEVDKAKLYIAVSNFQETNILSCIIAKKLGSAMTIARIDNEEYLTKDNEEMLRNLGVDYLIYPEILASEDIAKHLKYPRILKTISFATGRMFLFTIKVAEDSELNKITLIEFDKLFETVQARAVAIVRNNTTIIPHGNDDIRTDDIVYILSNIEGRDKINEIMGIEKAGVHSIMILGGSKIGVNLAKKLEKDYYIKLFEKSQDKSFLIADELKETLVIHSEARDAGFLMDEGITRTDVFIAVTDNTEINMLSCMLAKKLGVKKTFSEVENTDYLDLIKNTDIDYVINKKLIAASKIYSFSLDAEVVGMQYFTETDAQIIEFVVHEKSKVIKHPLRELNFPEYAIIGGINRNGEIFIAVGDSQIEPNDRVIVFCLPNYTDKIAKWFK